MDEFSACMSVQTARKSQRWQKSPGKLVSKFAAVGAANYRITKVLRDSSWRIKILSFILRARKITRSSDTTHVQHITTRNSSGDEIANINFIYYDDIVHALQNTIDLCINSATDRRGYALERRFTKFSEITQCNGHYAVHGHSRSPILVPIESSYTTSY